MRICRHDALVDIVCYALSQSHPGVLKEQRVSCEDHSRPGDVYHPDFQYGRPAYFDVSVHSATQPSYVSSASGGWGVGQGPETSRCYRGDRVRFYSSGVWSPFSLRMLQTIADRTTACSGCFTKLARSHFLQQLSVSLLSNNARMIL